MPAQRGHDERRGVLLLILSALAFSAMSVQVKLAGETLPVATLVLARGFVSLVISVVWLKLRRIPPWGHDKRGLTLRALFGVGGLACFFYAVTALPLAEVTVLHFTNPILVAVIAALLLGEKVDPRLAISIAVALVGTVLVARPGFVFGTESALSAAGVAAALGGALFSACAYATVRRLTATEHPDVIVFYFALIATPIAIPFAVMSWRTPSAVGWLWLIGLGVATQVGQALMTRGLAHVPAARGTTIGYIQIVFASIWGVAVFDEKLNALTLVGAALVVVAVVLLLAQRGAASPPPPSPPSTDAA